MEPFDFKNSNEASAVVLLTGGYNNDEVTLADSELYNPTLGTWTRTGSLNSARAQFSLVLLPNGSGKPGFLLVSIHAGRSCTGEAVLIFELALP